MDEEMQHMAMESPISAAALGLPAHLTDITLTATSPNVQRVANGNGFQQLPPGHSKYAQLLAVIEEMGKDIRPTYAGNRGSAEKLKRGIVQARILVRECLMETERSARQ